MNLVEFEKYWETLCDAERSLLTSKGIEYSGEENRFKNFDELSEELGTEPEFIAWVYFRKHIDSIKNYIKNINNEGYTSKLSEPIEGRINDARNYLALLGGMIARRARTKLFDTTKTASEMRKEMMRLANMQELHIPKK